MSWSKSTSVLLAVALFFSVGFARQSPLVQPAELQAAKLNPGVVVIDLRPEEEFLAGHIPGAVNLEPAKLRDGRDRETWIPSPPEIAKIIRPLGVNNDSRVIAYDDEGGRQAIRLWFVLGAYGFENVQVLDGGIKSWEREELELSTEPVRPGAGDFTPRVTENWVCPATEFLERDPSVLVIDARSPEEHTGQQATPEAEAGRVPGSVNVEWKLNLREDGTFKSLDELRELYEGRGITPDKTIIIHCGNGARAAHVLFALRMLNYPNVRVYYGSMVDYSARPGVPFERSPN
ncbi:MAG: sulfurtransferase [Fimbriimonadaceae bacterium]